MITSASTMESVMRVLLSSLVVLISLYPSGSATEYHVYPRGYDNSSCLETNNDGCRNLSFYLANSDMYFTDDTVFYFYPGTHVLESHKLVEVTDVNNVTFQGLGQQVETDYDTVTLSTVTIDCQSNFTSGFSFENSTDVTLRGLTFANCGGNSAALGDINTLYSLVFDSVANVVMESVSVVNTTGVGVALASCWNITVSECSFAFNQASSSCIDTEFLCGGGNAVILYPNYDDEQDSINVLIVNSNFSYGFSTVPGECGGLTLDYGMTSPLSVVYDGLVAHGNTGIQGGNFYFTVSSLANFTLSVNNVMSTSGNVFHKVPTEITDNIQQTGAGFHFLESSFSRDRFRYATVTITNSEFSNGIAYSYGGLSLSWLVKNVQNTRVVLENCTFSNNTGRQGAGLYVYAQRSLQSQDLLVTTKNIRVINNKGYTGTGSVNSGVMAQNLYIEAENLIVVNNKLSGMILIGSILAITGNSSFIGNEGVRGGGIAFYESSVILLLSPVYIAFLNNTASVRGGGLYIDQVSYVSDPDCFYQFDDSRIALRPIITTMYFNGNVAGEAGDVLFGGDVAQCTSSLGFFQLFNYPNQSGISVVSSNAMYACFCDNESVPDCGIKDQDMSISPGQMFVTQLAAVGQFSGVVSGIVLITDDTNNANEQRTVRNLDSTCTNVSYSINVMDESQNSSTLLFTVEQPTDSSAERSINTADIKLNLNILPCPPGFQIDRITGKCTCIGELENVRTVVCDVTTEEMSREGSVWMGYDSENECTIVREDCPYDYCNTDNVTFSITEPDPQCALNRAGIMCGACAESYSLKLGSNRCGKCSNVSILLILFFAVAGILIVVAITFLNTTLSVGTINGLIFYGNIVKINEDIFFPNGPIPVLSQFISWINLDFGIETCFYDGMTATAKAWLQFVFPMYLWFIVVLIILLSRVSGKISKLFGRNSLSVLATLILLSYVKLIRTIINSLIGTTIQCGPRKAISAWYVDPNVQYNEPSHLILVIVAGVFLFMLCLPFTIVFLFNQFIIIAMASNSCVKLGCSQTRLRLRLFFDAYNAPYKTNWRSWTGILLTFRFIIVLVIAFSSNENTLLATSCLLAITVSIFAIAEGVYKNKYLNILEAWFIFNLLFLVSFASKKNYVQTEIATAVSSSLTLVTFIGIIVFHLWLKLIETNFGQRLKSKITTVMPKNATTDTDNKGDMYLSNDGSQMMSGNTSTIRTTSIGMDLRRRETLLQDLLGNSSVVEAAEPVTV